MQVVVTDSPVCVTQQVIKLLLFNFRFRHLYYVRQPKPAKGRRWVRECCITVLVKHGTSAREKTEHLNKKAMERPRVLRKPTFPALSRGLAGALAREARG